MSKDSMSGKKKKPGGPPPARSDTGVRFVKGAADAADRKDMQIAQTGDEPFAGDAGAAEETEKNAEAVKAADEKFMRLAAEYDNFRKRTARERETLVSDTRFNVLKQLLPVLDNLERAAAQPCQDEAYAQGVTMTLRQFLELLEKLEVKPIDAAGASFDPNLHDAVMHVDDENLPEQTVAEVFQTGYTAGGKVLRPSIVKVAN